MRRSSVEIDPNQPQNSRKSREISHDETMSRYENSAEDQPNCLKINQNQSNINRKSTKISRKSVENQPKINRKAVKDQPKIT